MAHARVLASTARAARRRPARVAVVRPRRRSRWRRSFALLLRAPLAIKLALAGLLLLALWLAVNWTYHVVRKPTELFFPVSGVLAKPPAETWRQYGSLFREHATATITPDFLAALAQIEAAGDPVARTYWRWRLAWNPLEWYRPASSAVGMYQITDGTFAEAQRYCVRDHVAVDDCWFDSFYTRVWPSHAIEMTSALLDRTVAATLARHRIARATLQQKQDLAALVHLCGAGVGDTYARRGLRLAPNQQCGDHPAAGYLAKLNAAKRQFQRLAAATP